MSARFVLWSHAAVVVYTGAVVHMDRLGILNFWIVNSQGVNDYSVLGKLV